MKMRLTFIFIFCFLYFVVFNSCDNPSPPHPSYLMTLKIYLSELVTNTFVLIKDIKSSLLDKDNIDLIKTQISEINCCNIFQIFILGFGVITLLWLSYLELCNHVRYVTFNTNLSTCNRRKIRFNSHLCFSTYLSLILNGLLIYEIISEYSDNIILLLFMHNNPNIGNFINLALKFSKIVSRTFFITHPIFFFSISVSPATHILCIIVFQIWCHSCTRNVPHWLPIILIILSNDINLNPGPHFQHNFFNFMSWNLNSLAKDNFQRVSLIEAHNSFFYYDFISICETSLNDTVEIPQTLLNDIHLFPLIILQTRDMVV